jgi:hypothetical protein
MKKASYAATLSSKGNSLRRTDPLLGKACPEPSRREAKGRFVGDEEEFVVNFKDTTQC